MMIHQPFSGPQTSSLPFIFWDYTGLQAGFLRFKNCTIVLSWTTCIHDLSFSCHIFIFPIPAMNSVIDHSLSVPVSAYPYPKIHHSIAASHAWPPDHSHFISNRPAVQHPIKCTAFLLKQEDTVMQWAFKMNSTPAAAEMLSFYWITEG